MAVKGTVIPFKGSDGLVDETENLTRCVKSGVKLFPQQQSMMKKGIYFPIDPPSVLSLSLLRRRRGH